MSLFNRIRRVFPDAAKVLEQAGFTSDSKLGTLDTTDLHELFPGACMIKMRYNLYDQSAGPSSRTKDKETMAQIKSLNLEAARVLQDLSGDLHLLDRTDLHELFPGVDKLKLRKEIFEIINPQMPADPSGWRKTLKGLMPSSNKEVRYKILYGGKSMDVYHQVVSKVTNKSWTNFVRTSEDHKVSLLFCPVVSRIACDAEAAIATIDDDKPVILVFLIHSFKVQSLSLMRSWSDTSNIVLHVHLFHHETKPGLLSCKENNTAISLIQKKLLEYAEESKQDKAHEKSQS